MSNSNNISLSNSNNTILFDDKFENIIIYFGLINILIVLIIIFYIVIYCIIRYKNQGNPSLNIHSFAMKKILSRNHLGPGQNYEFKSVNNASSIGESINQPNNMSLSEIKDKNFKDNIKNIINSSNLNNSGETGELKKKKKGKKKKQINNSDDIINVNSKEENNSIEMELDNNNNNI